MAGAWHRTGRPGRVAGSSRDLEARSARAFILSLVDGDNRDITLAEIAGHRKTGHGVRTCAATEHAFLGKRGSTFRKQTAHASEQYRPDVLTGRPRWFDGQTGLIRAV